MLGLGDRLQLLELFDAVMRGDAGGALGAVRRRSTRWAPTRWRWSQDLLEICHWLSRLKVAAGGDARAWASPPQAAERARAMAQALSLPVLARAWQMLLRGHRRGPRRRPTPRPRPRCCCCGSPASATCPRPPSWRACCGRRPAGDRRRDRSGAAPIGSRGRRRWRAAGVVAQAVAPQPSRRCRATQRARHLTARRPSPSWSTACATAARRRWRPGCRRART